MNIKIALFAVLPFCLLGVTACTYSSASGCQGLEVNGAWVRKAPASASVQAAYFVLKNIGGREITVRGVSSPDFDRAQMHETVSASGSSTMQPLKEFTIPPRGSVVFAPGGKHLMLFNPHLNFAGGDRVQLQFICGESKAHLPVSAEIRTAPPVSERAPG